MAEYTLNELCEFITDGTHQTPKYCESGGYVFLSSKDVTNRKIDWKHAKRIPESLHKKLHERLSPRVNDILLAKNGTTGVAALVDKDVVFDVYVSLAVLRPKESVYPLYLYYAVNSPVAKKQFNAGLKGIGVPNLHLNIIRNTRVHLPEFSEQVEICRRIDIIEQIINKRKEEIKYFDNLIKARFVEMFDETSPSVKLGDICRMINGDRGKNYPSGNDFVAEGVPFVNAGHLQNRQVDFSGMNYITEEKFDLLSQGKMQEDDILYCLRGSLGKHGLVTFERGAVASSLVILRCDKSKVLPKYLLYAIETPDIERQLKAANNGSSQPNLSAASVKAYDIKLPSLDEQRKFVVFVKQIEKSKLAAQKSLDKAQLLFDSLMQKYFG